MMPPFIEDLRSQPGYRLASLAVRTALCVVTFYLGWRLALGVVNSTPGPTGKLNTILLIIAMLAPGWFRDDLDYWSPLPTMWPNLIFLVVGLPVSIFVAFALGRPLHGMFVAMAALTPMMGLLFLGGLRALSQPAKYLGQYERVEEENAELLRPLLDEDQLLFISDEVNRNVALESKGFLILNLLIRASIVVAMIVIGIAPYVGSPYLASLVPNLAFGWTIVIGLLVTCGIYFDVMLVNRRSVLNAPIVIGFTCIVLVNKMTSLIPDEIAAPALVVLFLGNAALMIAIAFSKLDALAEIRQAFRYFYWLKRENRTLGMGELWEHVEAIQERAYSNSGNS